MSPLPVGHPASIILCNDLMSSGASADIPRMWAMHPRLDCVCTLAKLAEHSQCSDVRPLRSALDGSHPRSIKASTA